MNTTTIKLTGGIETLIDERRALLDLANDGEGRSDLSVQTVIAQAEAIEAAASKHVPTSHNEALAMLSVAEELIADFGHEHELGILIGVSAYLTATNTASGESVPPPIRKIEHDDL